MRARGKAVISIAVLLAVVPVASAGDGRGVAINLGVVELTEPITPGRRYRLPRLRVRNPGDVRTSYRMVASAVRSGKRKSVPEGWFAFAPKELTLKPGRTRWVSVGLSVPDDAEPGEYVALAGARIAANGGGAQIGAAAAARVTFAVEPDRSAGWWQRLKTFVGDNAPWSYLVAVLLLGALLFRALTRRFALHVERRERVATHR